MKLNIKKDRYLIAVSAGPDSMALLDMMNKSDSYIEVAHINYQKRDTALRDEKIVKKYCKKHNIKFHLLKYKNELKGNFQANARKFRYDFFNKLCKENNLKAVLLGHHQDDLIETYLMQKQKNIGVDYYGLASSIIINSVLVIRPLLKYSKKDLLDYCVINNIEYGIDESNLTNHYQRNKIRHDIVEKLTNKDKKIIIKEINDLNKEKNNRIKKAKEYLNKEEYEVEEFLNIPYLEDYLHLYFKKSDKYISEMLRQLKDSQKCLFKSDIYILKEYSKIKIFPKPIEYEYIFNTYNDLSFKKYDYFKLSKKGNSKQAVTITDNDFPIVIRNYHNNDFIRMKYGSKKINRYFIDNKISLKDRLIYPVVLNKDNDIILVPGIGCNIDHYSNKANLFVIKL